MTNKKVVFRDHKPFFCQERNDGSGGFNMEIDSLLPYFNYEIELEPGTLFDDFWNLIAYCAGTGGSILIIGSAAGVASMSILKIDFLWYLKRISGYALLGYLSGIVVYYFTH